VRVNLPVTEKFSPVESFAEARVTGAEKVDQLVFVSDFLKVSARSGQLHLFLSTYDVEEAVFKLSAVELLVVAPQSGGQVIYVSPRPFEILRSHQQMQLVKLSDETVSLFFESQPAQANSFPFCFAD